MVVTAYVLVVLLAASVVGIMGYLAFGSKSSSIILSNMPKTGAIGVIARISYLFAIIGVWVIILQPIFYVIESSTWFKNLGKPANPSPDLPDQEELTN
jgi:hypothetical protein